MGEAKVELDGEQYLDSLCTENSRVWISSKSSLVKEGWDFGIIGSFPIQINPSTGRPHLEFTGGPSWQTCDPNSIKDTVTEKKLTIEQEICQT